MEFMDFIIDHWYLIIAFVAVGAAGGIAVYHFIKLPTNDQLDKVREWLLWAVTEAEKDLGSGTGQLKLRQVYDQFVARFPWLAKVVPFSTFSDLVDEALIDMREMLKHNEAVQAHVEGGAVK